MIRTLVPSDQQLYLDFAREFYNSDAVLHAVPDAQLLAGFQAVTTENPYTEGFLIASDGIPAGYAIVAQTYSVESGGMILWIEELFILPRFRGKGLGEEFIAFIEKKYAGAVRRFRLEVLAKNQGAIRLYERLGYKQFDYFQMIKDVPHPSCKGES